MEVVIGIDIGGTNTSFGFVNREGNILRKGNIPSSGHENIGGFIRALSGAISDEMAAISPILGIGIGAPNGNYFKGTIENAPNLEFKGIIPFAQMLSDSLAMKTVLTNDANATAIGEMLFGNAKGKKDFMLITLGTGLGSGIVVNGKVIYGHDGMAGEIGHTIVDLDGRLCSCGRKGCLETYVSIRGVLQTLKELLDGSDQGSELRQYEPDKVTPAMITEAAGKGDPVAIAVWDNTARYLALKLADAVAHTSPESIYIFGGLSQAGRWIMDPLRTYFEAYVLNVYKGRVSIELSGLDGNNAAILGAAALAFDKFS